MSEALADAIDALLPQTQCTRCGFEGCRPYAQAIAGGVAPINRCPPGGAAGIGKLAALLKTEPLALDESCGVEQPLMTARVDESLCIGCTLCIDACPVDAIVGAAKQMHTVVESLCTGCELCVAPCPMDCIAMVPAREPWNEVRAGDSRWRFNARRERLQRWRAEEEERLGSLAERTP